MLVPLMSERQQIEWWSDGHVGIALRLDYLNALLFQVWAGGVLDLDATSLLPEGMAGAFERLDVSGKFPPIALPADPRETDHLLEVQLGEVELNMIRADSDTADVMIFGIRAGLSPHLMAAKSFSSWSSTRRIRRT